MASQAQAQRRRNEPNPQRRPIKSIPQPRINRPPLPAGLDAEAMLRLFEQMTLLRRFEVAAGIACRKGETPGFLHLYVGEEAVATGRLRASEVERLDHLHPSRPRPCAGQGNGPEHR